jgi:hypothetical protein
LVALVLLAGLPIYLWRRPKAMFAPNADAGVSIEVEPDAGLVDDAGTTAALADAGGGGGGKKVTLADARIARCFHQGGGRVSSERCDPLAPVCDVLARAIRENAACAPPASAPFTVSFVWTVDFERRTTHLWAGRSGSLRRRSSADLIRCVERGLGSPDWSTTTHQYGKYDVNIMASYPAAKSLTE